MSKNQLSQSDNIQKVNSESDFSNNTPMENAVDNADSVEVMHADGIKVVKLTFIQDNITTILKPGMFLLSAHKGGHRVIKILSHNSVLAEFLDVINCPPILNIEESR